MSLITRNDYVLALASQDACNLSGIVIAFAEVMHRICEEGHRLKQGTSWKNQHPICRLYAEQILHLTNGGMSSRSDTWDLAMKECRERSQETVPQ